VHVKSDLGITYEEGLFLWVAIENNEGPSTVFNFFKEGSSIFLKCDTSVLEKVFLLLPQVLLDLAVPLPLDPKLKVE